MKATSEEIDDDKVAGLEGGTGEKTDPRLGRAEKLRRLILGTLEKEGVVPCNPKKGGIIPLRLGKEGVIPLKPGGRWGRR